MKRDIFTILKIERFKYLKQLPIFTILKIPINRKAISDHAQKIGGF